MKKTISPIILTILLLALEILPLGSALHISNPEGNHIVQYCSYFHLKPFADGNFAPFVVAVLSVVLLALCILYFAKPSAKLKKGIFAISCIAMLLSFCPLFYCMECYSLFACLVVLILFILTMIFVERAK